MQLVGAPFFCNENQPVQVDEIISFTSLSRNSECISLTLRTIAALVRQSFALGPEFFEGSLDLEALDSLQRL